MWVQFTDNYRHKISPAVVRHYKPTLEPISVPTAHGQAAIAAGKAIERTRPSRKKINEEAE